MKLTEKCQHCGKILEIVSETTLTSPSSELIQVIILYRCGHFSFVTKHISETKLGYSAIDGSPKATRKYQTDGVNFITESDCNAIIGDQQRLGKTPQSLVAFRENIDKMAPCLILVRSANMYQWLEEYSVWVSDNPEVYLVASGSKFIPPGFKAYILSMDSLRTKSIQTALANLEFKSVIADEVHSFKNSSSARSIALVEFIKEKAITHKIFLSGTPIKNRADEFFVPLNLIAPQKFPSLDHFRRKYLMRDSKGQYSRVSPYALDQFRKDISSFYLRREKEDVYEETPELNRMFSVITISDERLKKIYNQELDKMEEKISEGRGGYQSLSDNLMTLRRICGMAKVDWVVDYIDVMREESSQPKVAVGLHHEAVREMLLSKLSDLPNIYGRVMTLSGKDSPETKFRIMKDFEQPKYEIILANMIAAGVGMDFHYVDTVIVMERMWSSADEEQFEYRFYNPDKSIKDRSTNIEYVLAKGTIDQFFYEMVEQKRQIFGETIGTNWSLTEDSSSFNELMERTVASRL